MKRRTAHHPETLLLAGLLLALVLGAASLRAAPTFELCLEVTGTGGVSTLAVGTAEGATDHADPGIDALVPPVPGGTARVRLIAPTDGRSLTRDFRATLDGARYYLEIVPGADTVTPGPSVNLTWEPDALPAGRNWHVWRLTGYPFAPVYGAPVPGSASAMATEPFNRGVPVPPDAAQKAVYFVIGTPAAPTLASISPELGPSAGGTTVTLTGTGFLPGASVTFGGLAATDVQVSGAYTITARTPGGAYSGAAVAVQVTNPDGGVASVPNAFTFDDPPTAHAGGPYSIGLCAGATLDAGASSDPNQPRAELSYAWDLDNDGIFETTSAQTVAVEAQPWLLTCTCAELGNPGPGAHTVAVRVTDSHGLASVATATVTRLNLMPTADAGGDYVMDEGASLELDASGSTDPDACASIALYEWDLDGDGDYRDLVTPTPTPPPLNWATVVALGISGIADPLTGLPKHPIGLRLTDAAGDSAVDTSATLTIYRNLPRAAFTVNGGAPPFAAVATLTDVALAATATHGKPGVANVRFDWDFHYDAPRFELCGTGQSVTTRFPEWGRYQVALRVTDENGRTAMHVETVTVNSGSGGMPPVTAASGGPYTVPVLAALALNASASTGFGLTYAWDLNDDGEYDDANGSTVSVSAARLAVMGLGVGVHNMHLRVTDAVGVQAVASTTLTIVNDATSDPTAWTFPLQVAFGSESELVIGVAPTASQGLDELDGEAFGHARDGAFTALHTLNGGPALQRAINSNDSDGNAAADYADWLLQVTAGTNDPCYLWWDDDNPTATQLWLLELEPSGGIPAVDAPLPAGFAPAPMSAGGSLLVAPGQTRYYRIVYGALTQTHEFKPGWNLFSLPSTPFDPLLAALVQNPDCLPGSCFGWTGTDYAPVTTFEALPGYWVYFSAAVTIPVTGIRSNDRNQPLATGWNLVGVCAARNLENNPDLFLPGYWYDASAAVFEPVAAGDPLVVGRGYWFYALRPTLLNPHP